MVKKLLKGYYNYSLVIKFIVIKEVLRYYRNYNKLLFRIKTLGTITSYRNTRQQNLKFIVKKPLKHYYNYSFSYYYI